MHDEQQIINTRDFSKFCENLNLSPNQLMYWEETPGSRLHATHPCMTDLTQPEKVTKWSTIFKHIPRDQIVAIQRKLKEEFKIIK